VGTSGRVAFGATVGAFLWSGALVAAALGLATSTGATADGTGTIVTTRMTLVDVNGPWVLVPVGVPLVLTVVAWVALHGKCSGGGRAFGRVAWGCVAALAAFSVVAAASIGPLVTPAVALLAVAASLTPGE
jgi:hypothetical protein